MEYFKASGNLAATFVVKEDDECFLQIKYQNGRLGEIQSFSQSWNFPRWQSQYDVEEIERSDVPDGLVEYAEDYFS